MDDGIHPFANGTQYADWSEANCERCKKGGDVYSSDLPLCDIEAALLTAYIGDGKVSLPIAERMGLLDHRPPRAEEFSYNWRCPEFEEKTP